jgi:sugar lactone lactonase YvrE
MNSYDAVTASREIYGLGEGPFWDSHRQRVFWVDVNAGTVHIGDLRDDQVSPRKQLTFPGTVAAVVCSARGDLLVAGARNLHTVSVDGVITPWLELIQGDKVSRLNDGGCDPAGRFLVGSLALDDRQRCEVLSRIESSGLVTVIDDDLSLSNGLAWSPDGTLLYSVDTTPGLVWVRGYHPETGAIGKRREFLQVTGGFPDGVCVDVDGNLWIAIWGAGEVRCYSPSARHLATVAVAAPNTSSVAFVGRNLDTLLITTASEQLSDSQRAQYPDSGRLFTCRVGTIGLPVPPWSGP